jgi:Protein of unknown function (DUF2510)
MSMPTSEPLAPGWYRDPYLGSTLRYFDGGGWTQHTAPEPRAQAAYPAVPTSTPVGADPSDPVHWLLPTGRTWQSIAAGYVALFAMFLWPLGPISLGLGLWALSIPKGSGTHGRGRAIFAVVVGVLSSIGMVALLVT